MSHDRSALIAQLRDTLTQQRYSLAVVNNYCRYANQFLHYLARRKIAVEAATPAEVSNFLRYAARLFHEWYGRAPGPNWTSIVRSASHALLRLVQKTWPPELAATTPGEVACRTVCAAYHEWLNVERGLAVATITDLMWEARHFLSWYIARPGIVNFIELNIRDVDTYFEMMAPRLRRRSRKGLAERLRTLMRYLHRTGHTSADLALQIIAPTMYAYETIPSALSSDQIAAVLSTTRQDQSPMGLRDYAILLLLSTYGLRSGEIKRLRLDDINWRAATLRIHHTKNGTYSFLPLMDQVGEALHNYLRRGRPKTTFERSSFARAHPIERFTGFTARSSDD
jgi:site-specific recombinase XerD